MACLAAEPHDFGLLLFSLAAVETACHLRMTKTLRWLRRDLRLADNPADYPGRGSHKTK